MGDSDSGTGEHRKPARSSRWTDLLQWLGPVALAVAGWAHSLLWAHEGRLTTLEVKREADDKGTAETDRRWEKELSALRTSIEKRLDQIDSKLERPR